MASISAPPTVHKLEGVEVIMKLEVELEAPGIGPGTPHAPSASKRWAQLTLVRLLDVSFGEEFKLRLTRTLLLEGGGGASG